MGTNNRGFMLIQVLMGTALLGVLGLAFAGLMRDMMLENQGLQSKASELALTQALTQQVTKPQTCFDSLVNKAYTPTKALRFKLNTADADTNAVGAGSVLQAWGLRVVSFNYVRSSTAVNSFSGHTVYVGDMEIDVQALNGKKMAYQRKNLGKLFFRVRDSDQQIQSCYTTASSEGTTEKMCMDLGGVYSRATDKCDLSGLRNQIVSKIGSCPSGQAILGFDGSGAKICGEPPNKLGSVGNCDSGQTLTGFNSDGSKVCSAITVASSGQSKLPKHCTMSTDRKQTGKNCCPGNAGSCVKTGEGTRHDPSGGRGGSDVNTDIYLCFCSE